MRIQNYIDVIKKIKRMCSIKIILSNIIVITLLLLSAIVTLSSIFSSDTVTKLLHIDNIIQPEALSIAMIIFSISMMIKGFDKESEIENVVRYNSIIRYDQSIPENERDKFVIERDIEHLYYWINKYNNSSDEIDSNIHKRRMKFRRGITFVTVVLGGIIFIYGIIKGETLPLIMVKVGFWIYPMVLIEYLHSVYDREKSFSKWKENLWKNKSIEEYKNETKGLMSLECKVTIMKQTLQRLKYRYLIWNKSALVFSIFALFFSILELSNKMEWFIRFIDLPFNNLQVVSLILLFISSTISIIQLLLDKYQIGIITRMTYLCDLSNRDDEAKGKILSEGFSSLISEGVINDLDIARGKFEITMKRVESKQEIRYADCSIKENEIRTELSRINGFLIYALVEISIYSLWYKKWNLLLFVELAGVSLTIYLVAFIVVYLVKKQSYIRLLKKTDNVWREKT